MALRGRASTKTTSRGPLVVDQVLGAVGPQPTLVERRVVADDDGRHPLAAAVVGQAEHGRLPHARALVDHPLDDLRDRR